LMVTTLGNLGSSAGSILALLIIYLGWV
jgi:hypothetical protein